MKAVLGWVRDSNGRVLSRPIKTDVCNAVTSFAGGGITNTKEGYGMGSTCPYVIEILMLNDNDTAKAYDTFHYDNDTAKAYDNDN